MSAKHKVGIVAALVVALGVAILFASSVATPHLTMSVVSRTPKQDYEECVIGLTNNGPTVTYRGYSKDNPIYMHVYDTPAGAVTNSLAGCGLGLNERTLAATEGVQFHAWFIATNPPTRMVLQYRDARPARQIARPRTRISSRQNPGARVAQRRSPIVELRARSAPSSPLPSRLHCSRLFLRRCRCRPESILPVPNLTKVLFTFVRERGIASVVNTIFADRV